MFSMVFQDFFLLALPLGENVAGAVEYDEERVRECLAKAGFGPRLARMEKGLQTSLYRILVFRDGQLVQEGTHEELLRDSRGLYSRMWEAQAQYYQED